MTCIAAAVDHDGTVWMGGDAVSVQGQGCVRMGARSKVFRLGEFLIGASGTLHAAQIVEHLLEPPEVTDPLYRYMVKDFAVALRMVVKEHGGEVTNNGTTEIDGHYLIGIRCQIFEIDPGYGVFTPRASFHAIGGAAQEAMAGMFTASKFLTSGEEIVRRGLLAAAEFDINIRPPFTILNSRDVSGGMKDNAEKNG